MRRERPGVPIEEIPSAPRPIEGVGTAIAAFIGVAEEGPFSPSFVRSPDEFARRWPGDAALAQAVRGYFDNGGSRAWIAPVERLEPSIAGAAVEAMDRDVTLVAITADPAAPPEVIAAAARAMSNRRALLLTEGPWADAQSAIAAMTADPAGAVGAEGPNIAVYWPRVRRARGDGGVQDISPLGPVAGMIARIDATRGVSRAPSGSDARLAGVIDPAARVSTEEAGMLNGMGVNVIRSFQGRGTAVWGARTQSTDSEWKYVPVRRTALYLEESLERGLSWVVFEPNAEPLWGAVRRLVTDFLLGLYREGALLGTKPEQAFFVRCDRTTMTQDDIDGGRLVCVVGVSLVRPAEFVILRVVVQAATADG
ncbi:MAG TPA: phage tail sheath C-terminal domain-containing protein [Microbacterium sp.]|nr:phage tail sheath C-terminal domain-containing protein [Microbacterium sp.]